MKEMARNTLFYLVILLAVAYLAAPFELVGQRSVSDVKFVYQQF